MIISIVNLKLLLASIVAGAMAEDSGNPLLGNMTTLYQTPPFEQIRLENFELAFNVAIRMEYREIEAITDNDEEPTFENTVEAFEFSGKRFAMIDNIFRCMTMCNTSDSVMTLANRMQPMLTARQNSIYHNQQLFERIKSVYDRRDLLPMAHDQKILVEKIYRRFVRNGAELDEKGRKQYDELRIELDTLTRLFGQRIYRSRNAHLFHIPFDSGWRIKGMPSSIVERMARQARDDGDAGWTLLPRRATYQLFMTNCPDRESRRQLWESMTWCNIGGEYDNTGAVKLIAELRMRLANLLGYENYARYALEGRMLDTPEKVNDMLLQLLEAFREQARQEFDEIKTYTARQEGSPQYFAPWDWAYYNDKYKTEQLLIDENAIKPYLRIENVMYGILQPAKKLFGLRFIKNDDIQTYNPDVMRYEVRNNRGDFMGVVYFDLFARRNKRLGTWTTCLRDMWVEPHTHSEIKPIIQVCTNFPMPSRNGPTLLSFPDYLTLMREFGRAMQILQTNVRYKSLSGSNVCRDFSDLFTKMMEFWAVDKTFLGQWAVHYQTGKKIPRELVDKMVADENYQTALRNVELVSQAMIDMAWHSITEPVDISIEEFELRATEGTRFFNDSLTPSVSPEFYAIFSRGDAAGYYSYLWDEMLAADVLTAFRKNGSFDRKTVDSFRRDILAPGASEDPTTLYVRFCGHEPDIRHMLERK